MNSKISETIKKLNNMIQNERPNPIILKEVCQVLGESIDAGVFLTDRFGNVLSSYSKYEGLKAKNMFVKDLVGTMSTGKLYEKFMEISEIQNNINIHEFGLEETFKEMTNRVVATLIPLKTAGAQIGVLAVYRYDDVFSEDEILIGLISTTVISLIMLYIENAAKNLKERNLSVVKAAIETLSYSEYDAVIHIFEELNGMEGLLVASKVADKAGITRSVIVNALRKLESASVIESRSLGMKGTFIRVLNEYFLEEINSQKQ